MSKAFYYSSLIHVEKPVVYTLLWYSNFHSFKKTLQTIHPFVCSDVYVCREAEAEVEVERTAQISERFAYDTYTYVLYESGELSSS